MSKGQLLAILLIITAIFSFTKLGQHPIEEWDEARTGVNSIEMLQRNDFFNVYYAGQLDDWINKPPLVNWMMAASFDCLGYNEFALRFPSALAVLFAFYLLFLIICLYQSPYFAFLTCLLLLGGKGLIGFHVGRTGDFDGALVACLLAATYCFLKYIDFASKKAVYGAALFLGLAFWVKGPAAILLLPAWFLYLVFYKKLFSVLKDKNTYLSMVLFLSIVASWGLAMAIFGIEKESIYGNESTMGRLFWYDLVARFSNTDFETSSASHQTWDFFFIYLDHSFNVWNYVFYLTLAYGLYVLKKSKTHFFKAITRRPLLILSVCVWASLGLFLTVAASNHRWYMAPALPFLAITTTYGILFFIKKWQATTYILLGLLVFTLARRYNELWTPAPKNQFIESYCKTISTASNFTVLGYLPTQDIVLSLYFCHPNLQFIEKADELKQESKLLFTHQHFYKKNQESLQDYKVVAEGENYILLDK